MKPYTRFAVALGLVFAVILPGAPSQAFPAANAQNFSANDALLKDATEYAKDQQISVDEALRRLETQQQLGVLEGEVTDILGENYGGMWIQHKPEYRVIVASTDTDTASVAKSLRDLKLASLIEVRAVVHDLASLQKTQIDYLAQVRRLGTPADADINVFENRVEIYVTDVYALEEELEATGISLPSYVKIIQVASLSTQTADIYAGLTSNPCTVGFSVRNFLTGVTGVMSAYHCYAQSGSLSYNGTLLPLQGALYGGSHDVTYHSTPGYTPRNWVKDGSCGTCYRAVTGTVSRDSQVLNSWVCKYGVSTGNTCGYLISKTTAISGIPNVNATWMRVHRDGYNLALGGDSAGPVFSGNYAYGMIEGRVDPGDLIYMAINYISNLNLLVLTN